MGNPLVAQKQDSTTWHTGINVIDDAASVYDGVQSGSWIEGGLGVLGAGLDLLSMAMNPVGTLISYGLNWLIEHVKPLQDALNQLAGDADQIAAYAKTWNNIGSAVGQAAKDLATAVAKDTAAWTGQAADAYRANITDKINHLNAAATCANTIGTVVQIVGVLTAAVRALVRDMVTQAVGDFIQDALEEAFSLGLGTPVVVAQVVAQVSDWIDKITGVIKKLLNSVEALRPMMSKLEEIFAAIRKAMAAVHGHSVDDPRISGGDGTHVSSVDDPHAPGDTTTPSDATTSSDATTPSGTHTTDPASPAHDGDPAMSGQLPDDGLYSRVDGSQKPQPWPPDQRDPRFDYWESGKLKVTPENIQLVKEKYGIDIAPNTRVGINKGVRGIYGETNPVRGGARIDIAPQAFVNEEQLARTLYHENVHAQQLAGNGWAKPPTVEGRLAWENEAHAADEQWWRTHPLNQGQAK